MQVIFQDTRSPPDDVQLLQVPAEVQPRICETLGLRPEDEAARAAEGLVTHTDWRAGLRTIPAEYHCVKGVPGDVWVSLEGAVRACFLCAGWTLSQGGTRRQGMREIASFACKNK